MAKFVFSRSDITSVFGDFAHISQLGGIQIETVEDRARLSRLGVSNVQNDTMSGGVGKLVQKLLPAFSQQVHGDSADEPTSHLDLNGIDLWIGQLKAFDGALLVISHDRYFLDMVVDKIWELKDGKITRLGWLLGLLASKRRRATTPSRRI